MIKFHDILVEIGVNKPGKVKAVSGDYKGIYIKEGGNINYLYFWDGDENGPEYFPGYYCRIFKTYDEEDQKIIDILSNNRNFTNLGQWRNYNAEVWGILKKNIEIQK